jgi:hypothetical protein
LIESCDSSCGRILDKAILAVKQNGVDSDGRRPVIVFAQPIADVRRLPSFDRLSP